MGKIGTRYIKPRYSLTYLHLSGLWLMVVAFIAGSYFTLSTVLIPRLRALTESNHTMPTDTLFDRLADSGLAGYDDGGGATYVLGSEVTLATASAWWTTDYTAKKELTLKNLSTTPLASQSAVTQEIKVNTKQLYDDGKLQANCEDLRVAFVATESANMRQELPRSIATLAGTPCSESTSTTVAFPLQEPLWGGGGSSSNYELYYGNAGATDPGYGSQGYDITREDNATVSATLVCPFNGSTNCVNQDGLVTPTTQTGAIRYSGAMGSAMQFDGKDDALALSAGVLPAFGPYTIEAWINSTAVAYKSLFIANPYGTGIYVDFNPNGTISYARNNSSNVASTFSANSWIHFAFVFDGTYISIFKNGTQSSRVVSSGTLSTSSFNIYGPAGGLMDEVRISNTVRYTSNFTPQTTPFEPDEHTKLLLHFDENGDDPRNAGKAFDSSGNGNHGTIAGAKYVSGLVGVDNSSTSTGAIPASTTVSHQGVFIEEGTTNKITNPSFEHATYDTGWGTNYFNYATASATFTPSMAKRNSAGPFGAGVMIQGDFLSGGTLTDDYFTVSRGSQIASNFYQTIDNEQGTIQFWLTPEWNGNDGKPHMVINSGDYIWLYKTSTNMLYFHPSWLQGTQIDASGLVAGLTYLITIRWDKDNPLDGMNYIGISINDTHSFGRNSTITSNTPDDYNFGRNPYTQGWSQDGIIEGLTIYRRPLYDGQYGIDVGNGDEIAQIYNNGTGQDPTLVTGSWDVVFALPTNASAGALTSGTGNAWSHPHSSNLLYTNTTNTGGFMMNGTYTSDGWTDIGTPSVSASPTNQKVFSGGYAVTANQWEGIYYDKTVVAGDDWVIRGLAHSDGTCQPQLILYDQTNGAEIGSLYGTTLSTRADPDVLLFTGEAPAGMTTLRVKAVNAAASSGTCYWDQVEVLRNYISNASFESGSGDPWIPTSWNMFSAHPGDSIQETIDIHSGFSAFKYTNAVGNHQISTNETINIPTGNYVMFGGFVKTSGYPYSIGVADQNVAQTNFFNNDYVGLLSFSSSNVNWSHYSGIYRQTDPSEESRVGVNIGHFTAGQYGIFDDIYQFPMNPVSLTVTPANQANSTETTGLRVDGADTLTQPITDLSTDRGTVKFKFTPRHSFNTANKFGAANPTIIHLHEDANNQIRLLRQNDTTLRLAGTFNGTAINADWSNPTLNAGTTYAVEISYQAGGSLVLKIDGAEVATNTGVVAFDTPPTTAYFGTDNGGANSNPYDVTISNFVALTPTANTTAPYYKFGSKSAKLVNAGSMPDEYTIAINPASTATHTLSAYVYDGTSGNAGGAVSASVAMLVFNGAVVTPTAYTDTGGGWWRLTYSAATTNSSGLYGVQAQVGKTLYVDGVQLEEKGYATTYADGSLGTGYSWAGTANESGSVRTLADLRYPVSSNISTTQGSFSFWLKPTWSSGDGNWTYFFATGTNLGCGYLRLNTDSTNIRLWDGCSNGVMRSLTYTADSWIHVIVVWGPSNLNLFVNGINGAGSSTFNPRSIDYIHIGNAGNYSQLGQRGAITSDFRIFDEAITSIEAANLYHSGLQTHSSGTEAVDRYEASGTYTSPVIDLGANGAWGSTPWSASNVLGLGGLSYFTRTSPDNVTWSEWAGVTGTVGEGSWTGQIASNPRRYFQWKADLISSPDQSQTPVISNITTTYVEDTTAPENPQQVALGFSQEATAEADLVNNTWYNHSKPKFTWESGLDDPAAGQSSSGIDGYHVLLTTDQNATPSANLASPCYRFAQSNDRVFTVGSNPAGCQINDADYYLRVQTKDNSGNVASPVTLFTYRYDGTPPRSPASVSSTTIGYTSENGFTFFWPSATDQGSHQSQIVYYEYKTGATEGVFSDWVRSNQPGEPIITQAADITAYQEGQNFFFVRSVDWAGNVSAETSNLGVAPFYYNESAPSAPMNLVINPETSEDSPASDNIFTVTWDKPEEFSGEIAKYYYCVNCTPSKDTMTETTNAQTVDRVLTNVALATQQGKNTLYLVAEDNNINTQTGQGNVNFDAYATADFYAATIAPGAPTNLTISDASDRDAQIWRLTLAWKSAEAGGTPVKFVIKRSTDQGETYTVIGETSSSAYTDADLTQGSTYFYQVIAIDNANSSSLASNTVSLAPEGKYTSPPMTGGAPTVTTGSTIATITWSTGREAYGAVEYGKTTQYEQSVAETVAVVNHSVRLTGLTPGTLYHYRVQALDDSVLMGYDRETAYSGVYTFTTSATPTISNVLVSDQTLTSAVINWSAISLVTASIEYGESTAYGQSISVGVGSEGNYSTKLAGLSDNTTYHFRIRATDVDGTDITSDDYSFTTLTFPKVTAVVFKTDQAQNATAINLAWSTNVPVSSQVEYQPVRVDLSSSQTRAIPDLVVETATGAQLNLGVLQSLTPTQLASLPIMPAGAVEYYDRSPLLNRHLARISNLQDGSLYVFTIRGRDEYGNQVVSEPIRYATGADTKPPTVSNMIIETPIVGEGVESKAEIVISFNTDEPAYSQVLWGAGTGSEYPQATKTATEPTTEHIVVLRELSPSSSYHLKIKTTDLTGNNSETPDTVVVTPTAQAAAFELILKNLEGVFGFLRW